MIYTDSYIVSVYSASMHITIYTAVYRNPHRYTLYGTFLYCIESAVLYSELNTLYR